MALGAVVAVAAATAAVGATARGGSAAPGKPITIGAVVDLTGAMAPFDAPALTAAQIQVAKINAAGGVAGRKLRMLVCNWQFVPAKGKACAQRLLGQGADIMWVTCDVDWATPAIQPSLAAKKLTVAPCIGTDQMGPKRFGAAGRLAFSFGNVGQDEGAAMAEYAVRRGWKTAVTVTDNAIAYFQNICQAFTARFTQLGGKITAAESFTQGDKTVGNVVSKVIGEKSAVIASCTFPGDLSTFVTGVRSAKDETPIIQPWSGDGTYWLPESPKVSNYYVTTYASIFGDDPNPAVRDLIAKMKAQNKAPGTGGFVAGAAAVQGIAIAIGRAHGSTNGAVLAKVLEGFRGVPTVSGKISFSATLHSVSGRQYRVLQYTDSVPKVVGFVRAKVLPKI
jgi:branched-chain amino acid transport system substrate-binding protein